MAPPSKGTSPQRFGARSTTLRPSAVALVTVRTCQRQECFEPPTHAARAVSVMLGNSPSRLRGETTIAHSCGGVPLRPPNPRSPTLGVPAFDRARARAWQIIRAQMRARDHHRVGGHRGALLTWFLPAVQFNVA